MLKYVLNLVTRNSKESEIYIMGMIANYKRVSAEYDYYEFIIDKMQEIDRKKLPANQRAKQAKKDKEEKEQFLKKIPRKKLLSIGKNAKEYFKEAYDIGDIGKEEYKEFLTDLKKLDNRLKKSINFQAKKGTAEQTNENSKSTNKKKLNIKKVATGIILAGAILAGGTTLVVNYHNEQIRKEEQLEKQEAEREKQLEIQEAKETLKDKEYSVYKMAQTAIDNKDSASKGMELLDEVKDLFKKQYKEATGIDLKNISIIEDTIKISENPETGEIEHTDRNASAGYTNRGTDSRYIVYLGEIPNGDLNPDLILAECDGKGRAFWDSYAPKEGTEILSNMIISRGKEMIGIADDYKKHVRNWRINKYEAGDKMIAFYYQFNKCCEEIGIDFEQECANEYIVDGDGNRIACITREKTQEEKKEIEEAKKVIDKYEKENKKEGIRNVSIATEKSEWSIEL